MACSTLRTVISSLGRRKARVIGDVLLLLIVDIILQFVSRYKLKLLLLLLEIFIWIESVLQ